MNRGSSVSIVSGCGLRLSDRGSITGKGETIFPLFEVHEPNLIELTLISFNSIKLKLKELCSQQCLWVF
jgi:hypothetical protein